MALGIDQNVSLASIHRLSHAGLIRKPYIQLLAGELLGLLGVPRPPINRLQGASS